MRASLSLSRFMVGSSSGSGRRRFLGFVLRPKWSGRDRLIGKKGCPGVERRPVFWRLARMMFFNNRGEAL